MLRVYFGNDTIKVRQSAFSYVEELREQGLAVESIDSDNYQPGKVVNVTGSASLFGGQQVYTIDTPSENEEMNEETTAALEEMAKSENLFVVIENALLAADKKKFQKHAEQMEEHKKGAIERFNNFSLADALSRKDKKSLWVLFNEARLSGIAVEELVGVLWWQLKTLRLAATGQGPEATGLKDFPYQKAKRSLSKFKPGELAVLSHSLLKLVHESRLGRHDIDQALERWILKL